MFKNFQNCFLHAGIFLAFYKKIPNIYEFQNPLENNFNIFSSKFRLSTPWSSSIWLLELNGQRGAPADPPGGRPNPGSRCAGPTCSKGHLTVVVGLSSCAFARFPLNRGRERGVELYHAHTLTHTPSHKLCSGFHWILSQVWFQEISLSHFFAARTTTHLEEQLLGKNFIFVLPT